MAAINGGGILFAANINLFVAASKPWGINILPWQYDPQTAVIDANHHKDYNLNLYNSQVGPIPFRITM